MLISLSTLCLFSSWSRSHYYISLAFGNCFIQTPKWHQSESMVNSTCINLAQSIIFLNITHCQAVSTISKFYHVIGHAFITQWVILIFINYFSANQNLYNYAKWMYNIMKYTCNTKVWHAAIFGRQWFSQNDNFQCYPLVHVIFIYRYMYEEIFDFCLYNLGERFPNKT